MMKPKIQRFLSIFLPVISALILYEIYQFYKIKQYKQAAFLSQGLSVASMFKIAVTEHYMATEEWPEDNEHIGLLQPDHYAMGSLLKAEVIENGIIKLIFNETSGVQNGEIILIPLSSQSSHRLHWNCISKSFENIQKFMPQCSYNKSFKLEL